MANQGVLPQLRRWAYYLASRPPHWTWQCFNWLITRNVTNKRFFSHDDLSWSAGVEAKYPEVREEVERLLEHVKSMPTVHDMIPTTGYYFSERDWRQVTFFSYGTRIEDNCALYPNIWEAFSRVPDLVSGTVSILAPNEIVPAHEHSYKGLLIFHMGVVIPESGGGCGIRVDTEESRWHEGEVFAIDPTYDHEVWNRTDQYRAILLGEFRRPDLPGPFKFLDRIFIWAFGVSLGKRLAKEAATVAARHRQVIEGPSARRRLINEEARYVSLTFHQRMRKLVFHLVTRVPLWTIHAVNRRIARHTNDQPWHEGASFPWAHELEGHYDALREEISQALQRLAHLPTLQEILPTTELYAFPDDWRQVMLYTYGKRIDDNCAQYPKTAAAIEKIPGVVSSTLSILGPGEHIPPHQHHYKGLLIYHFGIIIPSGGRCEMRVGDEWRRWEEGKLVAIDPTFDHEVYNETDQYRIVLIGQFRRPDMPPVMRFLDGVYLGLMNATPMGRNMVRQVRARAAEQRAEIEAAMAAAVKPSA